MGTMVIVRHYKEAEYVLFSYSTLSSILRAYVCKYRGAHFPYSKKPFRQTNHTFTSLAKTFDRRIHRSAWLTHSQIRPKKLLLDIRHMQPYHGDYWSHHDIIHKAKDVLTYDKLFVRFNAPIGEYGDVWAQRLIAAGATLANDAISLSSPIHIRDKTLLLDIFHRRLLRTYTFRETLRLFNKGWGKRYGSQYSFAEAMQSTLYTTGFLTAHKVRGYENNPEKLLMDLAKEGVFSQFSLIVPPTLTAVMGNRGNIFANPTVIADENGRLTLHPHITTKLVTMAKTEFKDLTTGARPLERRGCPLGRRGKGNKESGVDIVARLLAETVIAQKKHFMQG